MSDETPQDNQSEIAHLLKLIDLEYQAAKLGLSGIAAGIAQHEFITKRMEGMQNAHENLEKIVGTDEAMRLIVQKLESSEKTQKLRENEGDQK